MFIQVIQSKSSRRQEVKDLTTLSPSTLDPTLKRLTSRLTGTFARQFDAFYLGSEEAFSSSVSTLTRW